MLHHRHLLLAWFALLVAAAATPSRAQAPAAPAPSPSGIMDACMKVEVPAALAKLGIVAEIRTREDAGAVAHTICEAVVRNCSANPGDEACQRQLKAYATGGTTYVAPRTAPLFDAAAAGATNTVLRLLADGADPNWRNVGGWTPVMIAAAERHLDTVVVLLEAKADPNLRNAYGRTALMFAASYGQTEIAQRLLDAGADVNAVPNDNSGWTALIAAAARGHAKTVELLLARGADPTIRAKDGKTALQLARELGNLDVVRLLEEAKVRA